MTEHARGTFTIDLRPVAEEGGPPGVGHFAFDKVFTGDIKGTSRGTMLSAGDPESGSAGYVVVEVVQGSIGGRHGTFALQHFGQMDAGDLRLDIAVVPGSGTGDLTGIRGSFDLRILDGTHSYDLAWSA